MTCQEFKDQLPDYLDETLDAAGRSDANRHLAACRECQLALQRTQALGRSLHAALQRETAHLTLAPETRAAILHAARATPSESSAGSGVWRWLSWSPLRALAAAAAVAAVLFVTIRWQRQRAESGAEPPGTHTLWSIDVPFQSGGQVGLIHAEFSKP